MFVNEKSGTSKSKIKRLRVQKKVDKIPIEEELRFLEKIEELKKEIDNLRETVDNLSEEIDLFRDRLDFHIGDDNEKL